jgi:hypothetical protein
MKIFLNIFLTCAVLASSPAVRGENEAPVKSNAVQIKHGPNGEVILTLDETAQNQIKLVVANPSVSEWQPEVTAFGRVADPLAFTAAAADYEAARAAAAVSQNDLERTKTLAAQENASSRVLESAQASAARDRFALQSLRAKFTADWGSKLAAQTNLAGYAEQLQAGELALVKVSLPSGTFLNQLPGSAKVLIFNNETNVVVASVADNLSVDPATQMQTLLLSVQEKLPANVAVAARLKLTEQPVVGVVIPPDAIVRFDNKGWVFVQTAPKEFSRREIALDRAVAGGLFSTELSPTNRIVVTGAQTLLSAELNGGNFNVGQRD